ncbi:MAG: Asp-tRNA(Asn)/Glu-tRNA(Gln) amidotransferase subunit GatB [Planctomycetes bacterium]|nr:Asp-tRNA(Asn)/Glu-tRNA(Gln) amidotransferase subunit GatB [Planctomycetota bacterium]
MTTHRIIIGLEVHVQLLTKTKLFCGCSTQFGLPPNSATCPICCGLPGTLPVMNREAFHLALKAATALNCKIASFTKWDRKNYYYPDLPKNYQISQYDLPFSSEGWLEIELPSGPKKVGIIRAHLEEDAGKMLHDEHAGKSDSLVDLNRTGTPLLEIVSKPAIDTPEEAKAYLEELRLLLREIGVSDCEMQEGSLRCDANINIHVPQADGTFIATPIIEIKNLNSFRGVERALKYEAERQANELRRSLDAGAWVVDSSRAKAFRDYAVIQVLTQRGSEVAKATAGWDERTGRTEIQRRKEEASDYRYFPEPDLVPVKVDAAILDKVRTELGELPAAQKARLQSQYGIPAYDAGILSRQGRAFVAYFEAVVKTCGDAKEACNWTINDLLSTLNERQLDINVCPLSPQGLGELIVEIKSTGLNKQRAREVYTAMLDGLTAKQAIDKLGFKVVGDEAQLLELVRRAIAANPKAVADFKKGKLKAADAIKGFVMRETKGMANTEVVQRLVMEELNRG